MEAFVLELHLGISQLDSSKLPNNDEEGDEMKLAYDQSENIIV